MHADDLIARITTGFLNTVDDALCGLGVSSGTGQMDYRGQLGKILSFTHEQVPWSGTQLYGGKYQYVKEYVSTSGTLVVGQVAFWNDETNYVVSADPSTGTSKIAGIYIKAFTKGQYGWIQVGGLAGIKFRASITKATPAIGDLVIVQSGQAVGDVLADATNITSVELRSVLGIAKTAPVGGAVSLVELWARYENI